MRAFKILVTGKVQGVGFRYYTKRLAEKLAISGTVKNLQTGAVEIIAVGERTALTNFIDALPTMNPYADVKDVSVEMLNDVVPFLRFSVIS